MSRGPRRLGVVALGRPSAEALDALLHDQAEAPTAYPGIGASLRAGSPPGWPSVTASTVVGHGADAFGDACAAVRSWAMHDGAGISVVPTAPIEVGAHVAAVAPAGPVSVLACCRIVAVVDEALRFGFAYGTLPVHPAVGEEAFVVEHQGDGAVVFTVHAFARPRWWAARLAGPLWRRVQRRTIERYIDGVAAFVAGHP